MDFTSSEITWCQKTSSAERESTAAMLLSTAGSTSTWTDSPLPVSDVGNSTGGGAGTGVSVTSLPLGSGSVGGRLMGGTLIVPPLSVGGDGVAWTGVVPSSPGGS